MFKIIKLKGLGVSIEMEKLTSNEGFVHFELVFLVNVCSTDLLS